jgi:hypothetical protein
LAAPLKPTGTWSAKHKDAALRKLAPAAGFIADAEAWEKLWTAWRPEEALPKVDFENELILVGTVPGPNLVLLNPDLDDSGNVSFVVAGTKIGGPGFGYKLVKIAHEGVKSVNGQPLAKSGVQGTLIIPKTVNAFTDHTMEILLFEYDPRLADAAATQVDKFAIEKFSHAADQETITPFHVGAKLSPRDDRSYYITVFVLKDGQRTHIGERDGKSGLCKVLTDGEPSEVKMVVRAVR